MQDTLSTSSTYRSSSLARRPGMIGGVCAGIGARFGQDPNLIRLIAVVCGLAGFPLSIAAYLIGWWVIPADVTVPVTERPGPMPRFAKIGLAVLALAAAIGATISLVSNTPIIWIALGAVVAWWVLVKD